MSFLSGPYGGVVLDDKVVLPTASPEELCCIALVKEWVKNHPINVLSEALIAEENVMAFLPPLGHTIFDDAVIPMLS